MAGPMQTGRGIGIVVREATHAALDRRRPERGPVPLRFDRVGSAWLEEHLGLPSGSIRTVRVVDHSSGTAARARIALDGDADVPEHLFVKSMPHDYFQHVLMNIFDLGTREVLAYRALGDAPPVRIPHCYVAVVDHRRRRNAMILEDLSATATFRTVIDTVTPAEAEAIVDALADLHAAFWNSARLSGDLQPLAGRSPAANALGDLIRNRLLGKLKGAVADLVPAAMQQQSRMLFERSAGIDQFWASQPQTLIHGDPHLGNLFFEADRPGFLDWQVATIGNGLHDVAYCLTASVEPCLLRGLERPLVARYVERLDAAGVALDAEHAWTLYRAGVTEFYLAAVATAASGERMQPADIARVGVSRAVAGVEANDSFNVLAALIDGRP